MMGYLYIFATIALTLYGQLVIKWQVGRAGAMPEATTDKLLFLSGLVLNPWVLSGFAAAFLASVCWMATLTKFQLSFAYPFMSLTFVGVLLASAFLFSEALTPAKWIGMGFLVVGIIIGAQRW